MDKVERPEPRKDEVKAEEPAAYTADEVKKIMACLDKEPLKWQALVHVLIDTGIRRGECCALKWSCIDFTTGAITIAGNLCYTVDKGVYLDTPKNGHTRTVYAGDETYPYCVNCAQNRRKRPSASMFSRKRTARSRCTHRAPPDT